MGPGAVFVGAAPFQLILYAHDVEDLRQGYTEVWQGISELLKKFETL